MKRKVILILFTLSILFLCVNIKALVIRPESTTSQVIIGGNFNVSIYVDVENGDPDIYGIEGKINYDSTKFTLNSATLNNTLNSWTEFSNPKTNGNNIFSIGSIQFQNPINTDKTIYTLNFTVKEVATLGNSTFSIVNLSASDNNADPVSVSEGEKNINIVSNDATLSSLSVTGYNISPTFNTNTTSYTLNVPTNISSITINGTKSDTNASVTGMGVKTLSYGTNTFNIVVTAADGVTTKTYVVVVTRALNNDATLSSLSVTGYNISPTFNTNTTSYTLNVPTNISSITINGTKSDTNASVTGMGVKTLSYGTNTFNIVVTAADGVTTKTYVVVVTRALNNDATLSSLSVTGYNISPTFNSNISNYTAIVEYDVSSIIINATASTLAKMTGIGEKTLKVGENKFTIIVTSADNSKISNYYITITRKTNKSTDNTIKSLSLLIGTQTKNIELKNAQTTYNIDIDDKITTSLEIKAELNDIKSNFVNNFGPRKIKLNVGNNAVLLKVLSESGLEKVYTININFNNKKDTNNYLKSLVLSEGTIKFQKEVEEYSIVIPYEKDKITIEAKSESDKSKIEIKNPETLIVGKNRIVITVTSESGGKREYIVNVIKENKQIIEDDNPTMDNPTPIVDTKNKLNIFIVIIIVICSIFFAGVLAKSIQKK